MPPRIAGHAEAPGDGSEKPDGGERAGAGLTAQDWLVRLLPVALLIVVGLAGLRGAVGTLRWDGPLHQDAVVLGVVLEVVIVTLFVIVLVRNGRGSQEPAAAKLRAVLLLVLGAGAIGAAVLVLAGLNPGARRDAGLPPIGTPRRHSSPFRRTRSGSALHFPVTVLLYALLVVVLLAGVAVSIWWARRLRPPIALRAGDVIAEDPEQLREAVESGRSALRTVDDAQAAIIACYLAMETTLAERGTARGAAGTPGELLTRATEAGLVRGTAAGQLTSLFYEARFSSHPLGHQQRDAAERALDELAADLAETEGAAR
jgi:hypothetical protein